MYECFTNGTACYLGDYICYLPPSTTELEMKKKFTRSPSIRWNLGCQNGRSDPSSDVFFHLLPLVCNQCWNQNLRLKKCTKTEGTPTSYVFSPLYIYIYKYMCVCIYIYMKLPGWGHVSIFGNFFFSRALFWEGRGGPPEVHQLPDDYGEAYIGNISDPLPGGSLRFKKFPSGNSPKHKKKQIQQKGVPRADLCK